MYNIVESIVQTAKIAFVTVVSFLNVPISDLIAIVSVLFIDYLGVLTILGQELK